MAKKIRFDEQDNAATPEYRQQRSDDQDVEGHVRIARTPEEIAQGNDFLMRNKPGDDEDTEGHVRLARTPEDAAQGNDRFANKPGDEQVKDARAL